MMKGVKQGDLISPKLFTACLESVFRKLNWKQVQKGIMFGDDIKSNIRFADDTAIFGNSLKELKVMLEELSIVNGKCQSWVVYEFYKNQSDDKQICSLQNKNNNSRN